MRENARVISGESWVIGWSRCLDRFCGDFWIMRKNGRYRKCVLIFVYIYKFVGINYVYVNVD